jgi:copper(I)-binding protein
LERPVKSVPVCGVAFLVVLGCDQNVQANAEPAATLGDIAVFDALAPASPAEGIGSLYLRIVNTGSVDDTLVVIEVADGNAQLHDVVTVGGATRMEPVERLPVPAGTTVRLVPGGYHVMLSGMTTRLEPGDSLEVVLGFAGAGRLDLVASVRTYTDVVQRLERSASR